MSLSIIARSTNAILQLMTDHEILGRVLSCIDPAAKELRVVRRNGRILLGLPASRSGARRALGLYQPQRPAALILTKALRGFAYLGLLDWVLPKARIETGSSGLLPAISGVNTGSCGILIGSPEHKTRRAIASYQTQTGWEVAKIAFGSEGQDVIRGEACALESLPASTPGLPAVLGLHCDAQISMLRLRYVQGRVLRKGEMNDAISLLKMWIANEPERAITEYSEWAPIHSALSVTEAGRSCIDRLTSFRLKPAVCHGDFARWNLVKQLDGNLVVLDWEWGRADGMPGLDLVHYFAQDARLVSRLKPSDVVRSVRSALTRRECRDYLESTGWIGDVDHAILASIAYTVGTKQQANEEVLNALLAEISSQ